MLYLVKLPKIVRLFGQISFGYLAKNRSAIWPDFVWLFGVSKMVLISSPCTSIAKENREKIWRCRRNALSLCPNIFYIMIGNELIPNPQDLIVCVKVGKVKRESFYEMARNIPSTILTSPMAPPSS